MPPKRSEPPKEQWQEAKAWVLAQGYKAAARHGKIGKGGFGTVYLAESLEDGSVAAVRFSSSWDRRQVAREVATLAMLQKHPHGNVLRCYAFETFGGLQMAQISPCALDDLLAWLEKRAVQAPAARALGRDACAGLAHLHSLKILHRDIKPANMLIFTQPQFHLQLSDFGTTRPVPEARRQQAMTPSVAPCLQANSTRIVYCSSSYIYF